LVCLENVFTLNEKLRAAKSSVSKRLFSNTSKENTGNSQPVNHDRSINFDALRTKSQKEVKEFFISRLSYPSKDKISYFNEDTRQVEDTPESVAVPYFFE
jgi:hypothetical protein